MAKQSLLQRAMAFMSGAKASTGYESARLMRVVDRIQAVNYSGKAQDKYDIQYLRDISRDFYRSNVLYRSIINQSVQTAIGKGFKLQSLSSNRQWAEKCEQLWEDFWQRPDITGILSGRQIEQMICREKFLAGDVLVLKLDGGKIQVIEADQVRRSMIDSGIETDEFGKPTKYWVAPYSENGMLNFGEAKPIDVKDVLFIVDQDRPSSLRGIPACQSSFPVLHRIEQICKAEVSAWQTLSRIALAITRNDGSMDIPNPYGTTEARTSTDATVELPRVQVFEESMIFNAAPGEEIKGVDRNVPGSNFTELLRSFVRLAGLPLAIPLEFILMDWTQSNYSQSRAVLQSTYEIFSVIQATLVSLFYTPLFCWKVEEWIANGDLDPIEDAHRHSFLKPSFPWIDPQKEAQAQQLKLELGLTTYASVCASLAMESDDVVALRRKEVEKAIAVAKDIKFQTGVDVPWQLFAGLKSPNTVDPVQPQALPADEEDEEDTDDNE